MRVARNPLRPAAGESERGERRIFIQIPAYRDSELGATVRDLLKKARYPQSLRIAILWQRGPNEELDLGFARGAELEVTEISHTNSRGCNWARAQLQQQWRGERFTLILDSHHRFAVGWDQKLLDAYDALLQRGVEKPIVTAYLPPYNPLTDPRGRRKRPLKIYPYERSRGLLLRLIGRPILTPQRATGPIPGDFVSLHCLFAGGEFNREVPFDPNCYFFGDEVATSLRAFTHGYDVYHPAEVVGWHCYERAYRVTHWEDHPNWEESEEVSLRRLRLLLSGRPLSQYGRGDRRGLREFEDRLLLKLCKPA
jgi:Glycosyltransferase (GlcNAc)